MHEVLDLTPSTREKNLTNESYRHIKRKLQSGMVVPTMWTGKRWGKRRTSLKPAWATCRPLLRKKSSTWSAVHPPWTDFTHSLADQHSRLCWLPQSHSASPHRLWSRLLSKLVFLTCLQRCRTALLNFGFSHSLKKLTNSILSKKFVLQAGLLICEIIRKEAKQRRIMH